MRPIIPSSFSNPFSSSSSQPTERSSTTSAFTSSSGNNNNNSGNPSMTTLQVSQPNATIMPTGTTASHTILPFTSATFSQGTFIRNDLLQERQSTNNSTSQFSSLNETSQQYVTSSFKNQYLHSSNNMFNPHPSSSTESTNRSCNNEKTTIFQNYIPMLRLDLLDVLYTLQQEGYSAETNYPQQQQLHEQQQQQQHQFHHQQLSSESFNSTNTNFLIQKDVSITQRENISPMDMRPFSTCSSLSTSLRNDLLKQHSSSSPVQSNPQQTCPTQQQLVVTIAPPPPSTPQSSIPNITFTSPSSSSSTIISSSLSAWSHPGSSAQTEVSSSSSSNILITHSSTQNTPQQPLAIVELQQPQTKSFVIHENEYEKKKVPKMKKAKSESYTNQKKMEFKMELNSKERKANVASNRFIQVVEKAEEETSSFSSSGRRTSASSSNSSPLSPSSKVSRP